jgi:transmembrane serine protease 9
MTDTNTFSRKLVRLGEHNSRTNPDCMDEVCAPPVQDIDIEEFFSYGGYGVPIAKHDIALLRLQHKPDMNGAYQEKLFNSKQYFTKQIIHIRLLH